MQKFLFQATRTSQEKFLEIVLVTTCPGISGDEHKSTPMKEINLTLDIPKIFQY